MPEHSPPSPNPKPTKRARQSSFDDASPTNGGNEGSPANEENNEGSVVGGGAADKASKAAAYSTFRNVSACNRCRLRKNRCDQKLPSCASCAKAGVACVGYDPITKKEIPRRYVMLSTLAYTAQDRGGVRRARRWPAQLTNTTAVMFITSKLGSTSSSPYLASTISLSPMQKISSPAHALASDQRDPSRRRASPSARTPPTAAMHQQPTSPSGQIWRRRRRLTPIRVCSIL